MDPEKTLLIIISGPSGVGQTTIADAVLKRRSNLGLVKGTTTRAQQKRKGGDTDHIFVTRSKFLALKKAGGFLETDKNVGEYYGTAWSEIKRVKKAGKTPLLTLTVKGHAQLKKNPDLEVCSIFIVPENLSILKKRILGRQKDLPKAKLEARLKTAKEFIKQKGAYDYTVINRQGKLPQAIKQTLKYIDSCLKVR